MLICMKLTDEEIRDLRSSLSHRRLKLGLTYADVGKLSKVHPSQVWRICAGEFRTKSNNVVQVCRVLGIKTESIAGPQLSDDPSWRQLEKSLRGLWDHTPEGAKRISGILDSMARL